MTPPGGIKGGTPLRPLPQQQQKTRNEGKTSSTGGVPGAAGGLAKARKGKRKGKADGSTGIGVGRYMGVGLEEMDEWEDDPEEHRHRRSVLSFLGDDEAMLLNEDDVDDAFEPLATVAPEFRPHVAARMAEARSLTSGSTMPNKKKKKKKRKKKRVADDE